MLNSSWFIMGNWIFFWLRFMTYGQLGWIDATAFAFGMLMEVPTGAVSDMVGKKKTLILAMALACLGFTLVAAAGEKYQVLIGFLIAQAGWAFYSGAGEALAFDSLKEKHQEDSFEQVISSSTALNTIATVASAFVGIALYEWNFRAPHFAIAFTYGLAFILAFFFSEPRVDTEKFSIQGYLNQLSQGFHQLLLPSLKRFMPLIFWLLGVNYMFSYGFIKPALAEYFGFLAKEQGIIFGSLVLVSGIAVHFIPWMRRQLSDAQGLIALTTMLGLGFALTGLLTGWWGLIVITLIIASGSLSQPWVSVVVNREIDSKYRATTLSTISMVIKIPYILVAVLAGGIIEAGHIMTFSVVTGLVTLTIVLINAILLTKKND
jgi:MFS family permease